MTYVMRQGRRIATVTDDLGITAKPPGRKNRDFVMLTRAQFERLCTIRRSEVPFKLFLLIQFLIFRSHTKSIRLANVTLAKYKISRGQKRRALLELETRGLIRVTRYRHRSPEIAIWGLP
jgi:hypothetical protein